ncbi:GntR family transcriptional regulator [Terrabacter terrae]|uniref:GntR family transcriptional regulator n=2 Tax=Terrabacter terrae TaxID=318434 RepID=A0ABP5FTY4_9MICO
MVQLALPDGAPSLAEAVVGAVRSGIAAGELLPDQTYSVYQLADLLGISRSPVREALLRLAEAGLVRIDRNRGFRVLKPQARDIEEIFDLRLALEPVAARRAAEHAGDAERDEIREAFAAMRAATSDEDRFWVADHAVHDRLMHAGGNRRAATIIERLRVTTALLGPPTTTAGRTLAEIRDEHEPIVTAILRRDGDAAERAMRDHLEHTGRLLARSLADPARVSSSAEPRRPCPATPSPAPPPQPSQAPHDIARPSPAAAP